MQRMTPLVMMRDQHRLRAAWVGVVVPFCLLQQLTSSAGVAAPFCPLQQLASLGVTADLQKPVVAAQVQLPQSMQERKPEVGLPMAA